MPTTSSHTATRPEIIRLLNTLIEVGIDAEKGYAEASADARDHDLKAELMTRAQDRAGFVRALQKAVSRLGSLPENEGTLRGALHRGWLEVRAGIEGRSDLMVLDACRQGEMAARRTYDRAIGEVPLDTLPTEVRAIVQGQYAEIIDSLRAIERRIAHTH